MREEKRLCRACRQPSVTVGDSEHDACIARLPGVAFACCGHRDIRQRPYVSYIDATGEKPYGRHVTDDEALAEMRALGGDPPVGVTLRQRLDRCWYPVPAKLKAVYFILRGRGVIYGCDFEHSTPVGITNPCYIAHCSVGRGRETE